MKATWKKIAVRGDSKFAYLFSILGHDAIVVYNVNFGSRFERCAMVVKREGIGTIYHLPDYGRMFQLQEEVQNFIISLTNQSS